LSVARETLAGTHPFPPFFFFFFFPWIKVHTQYAKQTRPFSLPRETIPSFAGRSFCGGFSLPPPLFGHSDGNSAFSSPRRFFLPPFPTVVVVTECASPLSFFSNGHNQDVGIFPAFPFLFPPSGNFHPPQTSNKSDTCSAIPPFFPFPPFLVPHDSAGR